MINWGLAQNGAQNALAQGYQLGSAVRERKERAEFNALRREELEYRRAEREGAKEAAAQKSGIEGLEGFRPLLEEAVKGPEQYAMAYKAGADAGYDMSRVPTTYDPDWVNGQIMVLDAVKDPEKLDRIGKAMQAFGYTDPNQPGYNEAFQEFTRMTFAREGTDEYGRPVLVFPDVKPSQQRTPPARPQGVTDAQLMQQANEAIQQGADPQQVQERLRSFGVQF